MAPLPVQFVSAHIHVLDCRTRLPFRFGIHTLTDVPLCELALDVAMPGGTTVTGRASDLLIPKWFRKDPDSTPRADSMELLDSVEAALASLSGIAGASTVFATWQSLHEDRVGTRTHADPDVLVRGFGVALLERALIDAACRAADVSFVDAWQPDVLGFIPGAVHDELADWHFRPGRHESIDLRHTVGLLDVLRQEDVHEGIDDGLPESLEADIDAGGLRWFKLKIGGDPRKDLERLNAIGALVSARVDVEARFTLDANEQYGDLDALIEVLTHMPEFIRERIASIEQPVPRATTFDVDVSRLHAFAPVIIDEADSDLGAFARAMACGYGGVSVKNCKGVFQAVCNHGLCEVRGGGLFQSGEDLTNLASIPLQQDLATMSALDITHVERNGHHYFRGLDHLPGREVDAVVASCGDLYEQDDSCARLRVTDGRLMIGSLHKSGFGGHLGSIESVAVPADRWRRE